METETEIKTETVEKTDVEKRREEYQALKLENDNVESELLRREKLKAEMDLSGTGGGHQEVKEVELTPQEYVKQVMSGEIDGKK